MRQAVARVIRPSAAQALRWGMLACGLLSLASCLQEEPEALPYLGVNHTDEWVPTFLINGDGGVLNIPPQGGGGGTACCVSIPKHWSPDLKVTVKWRKQGHWLKDAQSKEVIQDGQKVLVEGPWVERTVPVPEYTTKDTEHFDVHFFPGDQVQVKVSFIYPRHKDYVPRYPPQHPAQAQPGAQHLASSI